MTDHKFTGQKLDGTGLMYYQSRYYDPALGAFISPDTIVPRPEGTRSNLFSYNRYMYVAGNPLRLTDSSGHVWETVADAAAISYDVYDIYQNGWSWGRAGTLAVDVAGTAVPFVPAPGACVRWCDDVLQYGDDAASWVGNKASDGWNATKRFFGYGDEAGDAAKVSADCLMNSFSADTLVMTAGGMKPIAELAEGDLVLAYNEATGCIEVHSITDTISHIDPAIVLLTIDGETLETTAEHPFYEMESAPWLIVGELQGHWTDAVDLQAGDLVWQADGTTGVVEAVEIVARQQRMYNLTVDVAHTFFVGDGEWLVHNAGPCGVGLQSKTGVVADARMKGYHVNVTNLKKGGVELSLQPGANNTILISAIGEGSARVNAGDYVGDVGTLLSQNKNAVIDQLNGIVSSLPGDNFRRKEAERLIEMITNSTYTVAPK